MADTINKDLMSILGLIMQKDTQDKQAITNAKQIDSYGKQIEASLEQNKIKQQTFNLQKLKEMKDLTKKGSKEASVIDAQIGSLLTGNNYISTEKKGLFGTKYGIKLNDTKAATGDNTVAEEKTAPVNKLLSMISGGSKSSSGAVDSGGQPVSDVDTLTSALGGTSNISEELAKVLGFSEDTASGIGKATPSALAGGLGALQSIGDPVKNFLVNAAQNRRDTSPLAKIADLIKSKISSLPDMISRATQPSQGAAQAHESLNKSTVAPESMFSSKDNLNKVPHELLMSLVDDSISSIEDTSSIDIAKLGKQDKSSFGKLLKAISLSIRKQGYRETDKRDDMRKKITALQKWLS